MKILLLTKEYPPYIYGGAGVHVTYLAKELAKLMPVEVRCFGNQHLSERNLSVKGFGLEEIMSCPNELKSPLDAARRGIDINAVGIDADLVHCHTWYTHLSGIMAKLLYGIPLVITVHSLEPLRPWKREQLGGGYDFSLWVEREALELADAIVAVSHETKKDILSLFPVSEKKIEVIHNGIDLEEYRVTKDPAVLKKWGINPQEPYLLFVGRITRQKGIIHLLHAIKKFQPGFQIILCASAPDTPEIAEEIEKAIIAVQQERPGIVWIRTMVDRQEMITLYSEAAVFVCPSIYEPFGIINLEAMACGVPVVATAVGGIKEVVVDGVTGFLVPLEQQQEGSFDPVNPEQFAADLAEKINQLMADSALQAKMGAAGRERVERFFSWQSIAKKTERLYEQVIAITKQNRE